MGLFDSLNKIAKEKLDEVLSSDNDSSLSKILTVAPAYVTDIVKNKEISIPGKLIQEKLKDKVKNVNIAKDGIIITANNANIFSNIDVSFTFIITSINLKKLTLNFLIKDINIEKSKESNFIQKILTPVLIPIVSVIIENIIKEKILNISNDEIKFQVNEKNNNLEGICDFSNVQNAKLITQKIPIINKSLAELVEVESIEHLDNEIKIKFNIIRE